MSFMLLSVININAIGFADAFKNQSKKKKAVAFSDNRSTEIKQPKEEKSLGERFVPIAEHWRLQNQSIEKKFKDNDITDPVLINATYTANNLLMQALIESALTINQE